MTSLRLPLWVFAGLLLVCAGCASSYREAPRPPDDWGVETQLGWYLDAWFLSQEPDDPADDPTVDPDAEPEQDPDRPPRDISSQEVRIGLRRLAFRHPEHVPTLVACGATAFADGDRASAERWLDDALDIQPAHVDAAVLRARLAVEAGNLAGARRVLQRVILLRPDGAEARQALAGIYYLQGDLASAAAELDAVERLAGRSARSAYHRGLLAERAEQLGEAADWYRYATENDPELDRAWQRWLAVSALSGEGEIEPTPRD